MREVLFIISVLFFFSSCTDRQYSVSDMSFCEYIIEGKIVLPDPVIALVDSSYYVCPDISIIHSKEDIISKGLLLYNRDICARYMWADDQDMFSYDNEIMSLLYSFDFPEILLEHVMTIEEYMVFSFIVQPKYFRLVAIANNPTYDLHVDLVDNFRFDKEYKIAVFPVFPKRFYYGLEKRIYRYIKENY